MVIAENKVANKNTSFLIGVSFLLLSILIELVCILQLNDGHFVYTLDDPYIHLALAENIHNGHYGVNSNEYSAPSSSILWPFVLAPLSSTTHAEYIPLLINILAAIGTAYLYWKILNRSLRDGNAQRKVLLVSFCLILLILATNVIGLIFTGMEHSVQLLLVVAIIWGLILVIETGKVKPWLIVFIVLAPLIRYENTAVSLSAIIFLYLQRYRKLSAYSAVLLITFLGGFSYFLMQLGLKPIPTSVIAKSSVVSSSVSINIIMSNFMYNMNSSTGLFLASALIGMLFFAFFSKNRSGTRHLAYVMVLSILLHLIFGRHGWYHRYEIYIWAIAIIALIYIYGDALRSIVIDDKIHKGITKILVISTLTVFVICTPYIMSLLTIPVASNNIYEQHYQMHRFAVNYYDKPIAVDDIGYVSYRNDNYVLDLTGLASIDALIHRNRNDDPQWMNDLANIHNVRFAMIYDNERRELPVNWTKIGELHLGRRLITPACRTVSFYVLDNQISSEILTLLHEYKNTLPSDVSFVFEP